MVTLWMVRNVVMAIKYAYCSRAELQDMRRHIVPKQTHLDRMILFGWITINPAHVERQIRMAALRMGVDVEATHFKAVPALTREDLRVYLPHVMDDSRSFGLGARLVADKDGTYSRLPVLAVVSQLVLDGNRHKIINVFSLSIAVAIVFAALGIITRAIEHKPVMGGTTWHDNVISAVFIFSVFIVSFTNFGYLFGGIGDFQRRRLLQKHLSMIITRGYEPLVSRRSADGARYFQEHGPLIFDLSVPENMVAWWASRQVSQDFGLSFYRRINYYTGSFIIFAAAMIGSLYYVVLTNTPLASVAVFVQVAYYFVALLVIISLLVMFGSKANQVRREQPLIFLRKKVVLETLILDSLATQEVKAQLQLSVDLLQTIARLADIDNVQMTVTILGFEAGGQFARSLLALALAGLGVFLRTFG